LSKTGKLDLDAPAKTYVPEISGLKVIEGFDEHGEPKLRAPKRDVTTRMLLLHTAGFSYDFFNAHYNRLGQEKGQPSVITSSKAALMTPLLFDPGERWEYGSNIDWCGQVIEAVAGKRLGEVFQTRIFEPLGMRDTTFELTDALSGRLAGMHAQRRRLTRANGLRASVAARGAHGRPRALQHGRRLHAVYPHVAERRASTGAC
jgi:methyl acetate hydrolase